MEQNTTTDLKENGW